MNGQGGNRRKRVLWPHAEHVNLKKTETQTNIQHYNIANAILEVTVTSARYTFIINIKLFLDISTSMLKHLNAGF